MHLDDIDRALLAGVHGAAAAFAMELLVAYGRAVGATRFIDIADAHVDGCLYHGEASIDFVRRLRDLGGRVRVPTTLNVGSIDLIHPELFRGDAATGAAGRDLMAIHEALGCLPTFTCAPYQTLFRPRFGEQIAWGESNAIVFANSVIGARTARYGDFTDLAAAMTARVPYAGMHVPENRRAEIVLALPADAGERFDPDALAVAVGAILGNRAGGTVAAITGLPATLPEDSLKALGATAASTGATALFHAVGITPEAPDLPTACQGIATAETIAVGDDDIAAALAGLATVPDGAPIAAVTLGTPHFSLAEFDRLMPLLAGFTPALGVDLYVNTARDTFAALTARGWRERLEAAGVTLVVDTCTYVTAVMRDLDGPAMTNSGKWAHYAPGNLGIDVAFGTLADCIASAARGRVTRAPR